MDRNATLQDRFNRRIDYLRLSVTDRCDLRCSYCMPQGFSDYEQPADWLTFDEIERVVARGDEDDFPVDSDRGHFPGEGPDPGRVHAAVRGQDVAAHLDDHAPCRLQERALVIALPHASSSLAARARSTA
jgi:hypothetical protein